MIGTADRELTGLQYRGVMGGSGINSAADLVAAAGRTSAARTVASPAQLVDFAVAQVLQDEAAADALPAILRMLTTILGGRSALAFRRGADQELAVLAAHPPRAAKNQALCAEIRALSAEHGAVAADAGCFQAPLASAGQPASVLMAYSVPDAGRRQCAVALVGNPASWNADSRAIARALAAIVAVQIRHANDTAELAEREARFRLLSQLAPVGIVQTDLTGVCTFANDRWCALTGMTAREAIGASWFSSLHPDDVERVERGRERAAAEDLEVRTDCRLRPSGADQVWVYIATVPVRAADGRPSGFLSAVINVSERKRAEAERERLLNAEREARRSLADQTERLNGLVAAAIPGILLDDEHGRITQVNQSFCDLFGISAAPSELIGTLTARTAIRIRRLFADPDEFLRRARELVTDRRPIALEEIACADGRTLEWDFAPVFADGCYRGSLWGVADATERHELAEQRERLLEAELAAREAAEQAQARLAEQNVRLQELDEAKTQFISTMSHELRTPLTSIISFTELIMDDEQELTPDTISSLSVIQRNAERLLRLVGDLLLLSRLENGVIPLDLAVVSVPDLVSEASRCVSASAADRGITVDVSAAPGPPLRADPMRLQQVFDNLLSNAVKYTGEGGKVRVNATAAGRRWRIDVADNGIGVPADELGHLFDRFVRASNARKAGLPGTGLGLAVVKAITELHGGSVEVRSVVGHGTMFSVYLPIDP